MAKEKGIKLDKRRKLWNVDGLKTFSFGAKTGATPASALEDAVASAKSLENCRLEVSTWTGKECTVYMTEAGLPKLSRSIMADRKESIAVHKWESMLSGNAPPKQAPGISKQPETVQAGSKQCAPDGSQSKISKLLDLPAAGKQTEKNLLMKDVTTSMFKDDGPTTDALAVTSSSTQEIPPSAKVLVPRIAVVKFVEAANVMIETGSILHGDALGTYLSKSKHKGRWMVQSLFVPDLAVDEAKNSMEHSEWLALHGSSRIIGRQGALGNASMFQFLGSTCAILGGAHMYI